MDIPAAVLLVTLAVIGAASVVRAICLRLFCAKDDGMVMYVTHIPADCGNAEFILRSALAKRRWCGVKSVSAVCVDCPMDEKTKRICEGICREYGVKNLMSKEEFIKSLD